LALRVWQGVVRKRCGEMMADTSPDSASQTKAAPYRVLARKYRPQSFADLIGQDAMVRTLRNAFSGGRIAQAWMLTGVRGVGKTTTARILARALNFKTDDIDAPTIDLDVEGQHCKAIMAGQHVDVLEMDAASHTGIDDIKQIIDGVRYAPVSARYKVYIIDEVHMLSDKAFNALLKTLEEPPPHVKFVFATTEIRKVPVTILSRCQRFDLRRIEAGMMLGHLRRIADAESIEAGDDALAMIARAGEGSVRDCLSLLDQAIAHGNGKVVEETVRAMLGLADRGRIVDLFGHLMAGEITEALRVYRDLYDIGADPVVTLSDLATFNHLVTRLRFVPDAADDPSLSAQERDRGREFAEKLPIRVLSRTWQMLLKGIPEAENAPRPVDAGEMVLIRIAHAADLPTLDEAIKSASDGPVAGSSPRHPNGAPPAPTGNASTSAGAASAVIGAAGRSGPRLAAASPQPRAEASQQPSVAITALADIVALADKHRDALFKANLKKYARPVAFERGSITISLDDDAPRTLINDISARLMDWTGARFMVSLTRERGGPTLAEQETAAREGLFDDARNDPDVAAVLNAFPGARIVDVKLADVAPDPGDVPISGSSDFPDNPDFAADSGDDD
jgi:DNA polymerase-3 subunit gamma/tau